MSHKLNDHFSHMHTTFGLGIEQCSNRHMTHVPETSARKMELIYTLVSSGACHGYDQSMSTVLLTELSYCYCTWTQSVLEVIK